MLHELGHAAGLDHNVATGSLMSDLLLLETPSKFSNKETESLRLTNGYGARLLSFPEFKDIDMSDVETSSVSLSCNYNKRKSG